MPYSTARVLRREIGNETSTIGSRPKRSFPWQVTNLGKILVIFLYHYTTTAGLIGIITSGRIWLTDAGFLNDAEELTYGAGKAATQLRTRAEEARSSSGDLGMNNYVAGALENVAHSIESINTPGTGRFEFPYVASFSEERDDLSQWRGYASDGYCIAFHRASLQNYLIPAGDDTAVNVEQGVPLLEKIHYGEDADIHLQNRISHTVTALYEHGYPAAPPGVNTYFTVKEMMVPALVLTKHPAFRAENEWRIHVGDASPVKFRASTQGPVPYVEIKFARNAIAEVMAGPGGNSNRRERAAEELLLRNDYISVPVTSSTAPYVG